jgi:glycosyltransferase involved in cell wall biosynthesis
VSLKVSVIVPVFNPGNDIEDCIRTTLDQSLPSDEYEVIFVDDGSTDATPARLDRLAAEHDNVRVEHIPNSGWPGKPRNVGMDMARGEFVYFVDNDDWIGREALERLYARATGDDADVVVGKVVGHGSGKRVPRGIFRENRSGVEFGWLPLLWLLSPHKLFRKAMLDEHGIRFPEGRRRLEDHLFVMHAYFHARSISVLADYACYHWMLRDRDVNASSRPFDPVEYYAGVREVLDLIDEHTEPGALRDRLYTRWLRGKLLGRAGGPPFLKWDEDYRRARYEEIRKLTLERFPESVDALLPLNWRVRAALVRAGDYEGLKALAAFEAGLRVVADTRVEPADGALELHVVARFARDAVRFDDHARWIPPEGVTFSEDRDAREDLAKSDLHVFVRGPLKVEFALPVTFTIDGTRARGIARFDPATAAAGSALPPGEWDAFALLTVAGFKTTGRLRRGPGDPIRLVVDEDGRVAGDRPELRSRLATRFPRAAKLAKRAGL